MLRTHYRQPIDWTLDGLKESWTLLERMYEGASSTTATQLGLGFMSALADDLNTPLALSELYRSPAEEVAGGLALLGFSGDTARLAAPSLRGDIDGAWVEEQITARNAARKARDFKEADRIRDELLAKGIVLKDGPTGTTWEVKR
jgi:cysteinyl-tRNA synthetase